MPVPTECKPLDEELKALLRDRTDLQAQQRSASPGLKGAFTAGIKHLNLLIHAKTAAFDGCVAQHAKTGQQDASTNPSPIASSFSGTATVTTDRRLKGEPFFFPVVTFGLSFNGPRTQSSITVFADWTTDTTLAANDLSGPLSFLFGANTTTVRLTSGGNGLYDKPTGTWVLPLLKLRFDHSRVNPLQDEDSDLVIPLSTVGGSAVTTAGLVTLSGRAPFSGGWLAGALATLVVTGTLAPVP